jgi:hypothetical protein
MSNRTDRDSHERGKAPSHLLRIAAKDVLDEIDSCKRDVLGHSIACIRVKSDGGLRHCACDCGSAELRKALNALRRAVGRPAFD